jgi:NADPH:quinone reductase-like Zn-dependent oxidoreductase
MWKITLGADLGLEHLKRQEVEVPRPGPGQVLVKVKAVALNYRDWEVINGHYHEVFQPGTVPLSDGSGEIVELGEGVSNLKLGDAVMSCFWQGWPAGSFRQALSAQTLGGPLNGMLSEYVLLPEEGVVRYPTHLSFEQAACFPCAGVTAWQALVVEGGIQAGDWVLVQGTGGVSIFAMQFAKLHGARVIALSSSDAKLDRIRQMGADLTLNYIDHPAWGSQVQHLTGGVDHVVEVGGPETFANSFQALFPGGQINVIGYLGGKAGEINPLQILQTQARVRGIAVGPTSSVKSMCRAVEASRLEPVVDQVFQLEDIQPAFEHFASGKHFGKIVVSI